MNKETNEHNATLNYW